MRATVFAVCLLALIASCLGIFAKDDEPNNSGQDPTKPVTRFDTRWEDVNLTDGENDIDEVGIDALRSLRADGAILHRASPHIRQLLKTQMS